MLNARGMYHEQVGKHFTSNQAWNLLKNIPKFKSLSGKAKNGRPLNATQSQPPEILSPTKQLDSPTASTAGPLRSKDWEQPPGIHQAKRKISEEEYKRKKMKLLKSSEKQSAKRTAKARRANLEAKHANNIQAEWVSINWERNEMNIMLQNVDTCTEEHARAYLIAKKKSILAHLMNAENASNTPDKQSSRDSNEDQSSRAPNASSSRPPTSEQDIGDESNQDESEEEEENSDNDSNADPTQTQNPFGPLEEEGFPLHPDLAFI